MISTRVIADGFGFLEGPRWHDGALWMSDMQQRRVIRMTSEGELLDEWSVDGRPSGLGFLPTGDLVVVDMSGQRLLATTGDGALTEYADLSAVSRGLCNDLTVGPDAMIYVGCMGFDVFAREPATAGHLIRVDTSGSASVFADGLELPNGMAPLPNGDLLVAETNAHRLTRLGIDDEGRVAARTTWADLKSLGPDGIALDSSGHVWLGANFERCFVRARAGGDIDRVIETPGRWAVACALGDADESLLFLLTAQTTMRDFRLGTSSARVELVDLAAVPG